MSYSVYERHKYAEGVKAADKVISRLVTFGFGTGKLKRLVWTNYYLCKQLESYWDYLIWIRIVWHSWYIYSWKAVALEIDIPCRLKSRQCRIFVILSVPNSQIVINIKLQFCTFWQNDKLDSWYRIFYSCLGYTIVWYIRIRSCRIGV